MSWILDQQQLHITIGSYPLTRIVGEARRIDLQNDLAMVKAALLYSDRAKLCSLSSSALLNVIALTDISTDKQWDFVQTLSSWGLFDEGTEKSIETIRGYYEYARRRRHSKRGQLLLKKFNRMLEKTWNDTVQHTENFVSGLGVEGIADAVNSGLLEVCTFESMLERIVRGTEHEEFVGEYINIVSSAVDSGRRYCPQRIQEVEVANTGRRTK